MASDKDSDRIHDKTCNSALEPAAVSRLFVNGQTEIDGDYSNDLGERLRAAFKARVIDQGLSGSSHGPRHAVSFSPMTEAGRTARKPAGHMTATIIAFRRSS